MSKYYFFVKNNESVGPVTKEQLLGEMVRDTLVWYEGLDNWKKASEIPELLETFQSTPPPIPKLEERKPDKIEVIVEKKKEPIITPKGEVAIANEIKNIAILLFLGICISFIVFVIKYTMEDGLKIGSLQNDFIQYQSDERQSYESLYSLFSTNRDSIHREWTKSNSQRLDDLYSKSKQLNCYKEKSLGYNSNYTFPSIDATMERIEGRLYWIKGEAKDTAIKAYFIIILVLIVGRYVLKSFKWVSDRT